MHILQHLHYITKYNSTTGHSHIYCMCAALINFLKKTGVIYIKLCAYKKCIATCCMEIHAADYKLSGSSKKRL